MWIYSPAKLKTIGLKEDDILIWFPLFILSHSQKRHSSFKSVHWDTNAPAQQMWFSHASRLLSSWLPPVLVLWLIFQASCVDLRVEHKEEKITKVCNNNAWWKLLKKWPRWLAGKYKVHGSSQWCPRWFSIPGLTLCETLMEAFWLSKIFQWMDYKSQKKKNPTKLNNNKKTLSLQFSVLFGCISASFAFL